MLINVQIWLLILNNLSIIAMEKSENFQIDQLDKQILVFLVSNARMAFSEIAKNLDVAPGTVHSRVKRMEDMGIIQGSTLRLDYEKLGMTFNAYLGIFLHQTSDSEQVLSELLKVPEVTVANLVTGQYSIFCQIRARNTRQAKDVIYAINDIDGIVRTESTISLEEAINDRVRLVENMLR